MKTGRREMGRIERGGEKRKDRKKKKEESEGTSERRVPEARAARRYDAGDYVRERRECVRGREMFVGWSEAEGERGR